MLRAVKKILWDLESDAEYPPRSDLNRLGGQCIGGFETGELAASTSVYTKVGTSMG